MMRLRTETEPLNIVLVPVELAICMMCTLSFVNCRPFPNASMAFRSGMTPLGPS